jgi:hypothetical protein
LHRTVAHASWIEAALHTLGAQGAGRNFAKAKFLPAMQPDKSPWARKGLKRYPFLPRGKKDTSGKPGPTDAPKNRRIKISLRVDSPAPFYTFYSFILYQKRKI